MRVLRTCLSVALVSVLVFAVVPAYAVPTTINQSVSFLPDGQNGFFVGGYGNRTGFSKSSQDGGVNWSPQGDFSGAWFVDVSPESSTTALAVSSNNDALYKTTDRGVTWNGFGTIFGHPGANPAAIDRFANGNLVVAGELRAYNNAGDLAGIALSDTNGASWTTQFAGPIQPDPGGEENPPVTHARLTAFDAAATGGTGWAVGTEYTSTGGLGSVVAPYQNLAYKTTNSGSAWTTQTLSAPGTTGGNVVNAVVAVDANTAYASGTNRKWWLTTNGGTNWSALNLPLVASGGVNIWMFGNAIDATDANHIVIGGSHSGATGAVIWSTNAGATWTGKIVSPSIVRSVDMIDDTHWVAVGDNGLIARTEDGGANWTLPYSPPVTTGTLTGRVTRTDNGAPIAGVSVRAGNLPAVITAADGTYSVSDVPAGTYDVVYSHSLYASATRFDVPVPAGDVVTQDVALTPNSAPASVTRADGANRYSVAVLLASTARPDLRYTDVIVACGEDRAMADPLGAAGLAGAWDAPVLLTPSAKLDASTANLISAIRNANGGRVNIHVIGGTTSVPKAVYNKLSALKGAGSIERIDGANRYVVSAKMAARLPGELAARGKGAVAGVLVANVENPKAFYDALAASPISAHAHYALLGVRAGSVPGEAQGVLRSAPYAGKPRYAVNAAYLSGASRAAASSGVMASTGNRIDAAVSIARFGHDNHLVGYSTMGLANKLPDALTGGAMVGLLDGVMLYTDASPLAAATSAFASANKGEVTRGIVLGGPVSVKEATKNAFYSALQ